MADISKIHMFENGGKKEGRELGRITDRYGLTDGYELPDIADEGDEVEKLPDIADEGDEIDGLPDVDDKDDLFDKGIERTRELFKKVDHIFSISGLGEEKRIERRDKLKDIIRYCNPLEMVKSVAYFSTVSIVTKVNSFYRALDHYSPIEFDETIVGDIKNIFDEVVTPQFVKDYLEGTLLDPQYVAGEMTELTCKAVDAVTYIGGKAILGAAGVAEDAITFAVGTIADVAGHPEVAEKMYQTDIVDKVSDYIDEHYSGTELIKDIGECAEKVGEVGAYIGLGILAGSEGAAAAAAVGIGLARAGEATRAAVEKTGEYTHKELAYGIANGVMAVVAQKLASVIHIGMTNVGESLVETTKSIDGKVIQYIVEKVVGFGVAAGEGAIDTLIFDAQDILKNYVEYILEIDDDMAEVDFKKIAKDMGMGALESGMLFLAFSIMKDAGNYIGKKQDNEIKRVEFEETDIKKKDELLSKIQESISDPEGIQDVMERHPEKAEVWNKLIESMNEAIDVLNNPDSSPLEIRSAQNKLNGNFSQLKGQLFETVVKDALSDAGFDVEAQQRILKGESGGTRPDVIAKNNTKQNLQVFDINIKPGETLSIECKCGGSPYMTNQLENHIPNQLSGQEGTKVLLTTSDIKNTPNGLAEKVCKKYDAKLVVTEAGVDDVENAIKEVAGA